MPDEKKVGVWCVTVLVMLSTGCWGSMSSSLQTSDIASASEATRPALANQEKLEVAKEPLAPDLSNPKTPASRRFSSGEVLFIRNCADCHGWEGKGDGPVGQMLLKKPPSLRRSELFTQNTESEL